MLMVYTGESVDILGLYQGGIYDVKNVYTSKSRYVYGSICGQTSGSYYRQINLGTVKDFKRRWALYGTDN